MDLPTLLRTLSAWFTRTFSKPIPHIINNIKADNPMPEHTSRIPDWANAIKAGEGAAVALNNPGNLKYSTLTASWGGTKGRQATDGGWLCKFPTYEQGFTALRNFLTLGAENELIAFHKARTLETFTQVYAGNPPQGYIQRIADTLGVALTVDVSTFL